MTVTEVLGLLETNQLDAHRSARTQCLDTARLQEWKDEISNIVSKKGRKAWDQAVKFTNDYELVPSLCNPRKLNRAYFKLCEIIHDHQLMFPSEQNTAPLWNDDYCNIFTSVHIAEGPGAFIECVGDICRDMGMQHQWSAITLAPPPPVRGDNNTTADAVPDFDRRYLTSVERASICYGEDGTGNVKNIKNCEYFSQFVKGRHPHGVKLVTADGGFDVSGDYNGQENTFFELFAYEVLCALMVLSVGGNLIIKVFDLYSSHSQELINILNRMFHRIDIVKPRMSRPCNSEKYVVCMCLRSPTDITGSTPLDFNQINNTFTNMQVSAIKQTLEAVTMKNSSNKQNRKDEQKTIAENYLDEYL